MQAEYAAWLDSLPVALREGPTGEALQMIVDLDLDELDRRRASARLRTRLSRNA
jgi:hypothetical protein